MPRTLLVAVRDLFFGSKIDAAAKQGGLSLAWAPRTQPLRDAVRERRPDVVLADLGEPGMVEEIAAVKREAPSTRVLGFVGHVRADLVEAARAAGADEVLARGELAARLGEVLRRETGG